MAKWTWAELKKHWKQGEQWVEGQESHLAVLWARAMHAERLAANEAAEAAALAGDAVVTAVEPLAKGK